MLFFKYPLDGLNAMAKTYWVDFKTAKKFETKLGFNHHEEFTLLADARIYACRAIRSGYVSGRPGYSGGLGQDAVIKGISNGGKVSTYEVVSANSNGLVVEQSETDPDSGRIRRRMGIVDPKTGKVRTATWSEWIRPRF